MIELFFLDTIKEVNLSSELIPIPDGIPIVKGLNRIANESALSNFLKIVKDRWGVDLQSDSSRVRYWKVAPGEQAFDWEHQKNFGIIGIAWGEIGDISGKSYGEVLRLLNKFWPDSISNIARQFRDFMSIKKGDIIIANKGMSKVLGIGKVVGDYQFDSDPVHAHTYPVEWFDTSEREIPQQTSWFITVKSVSKDRYNQILSSKTVSSVLSKDEFENLVKKFDQNKNIFTEPWHRPYYSDEEKAHQREDFITRFPPENIDKITLEQYALGLNDESGERNRSNFSYMLEKKVRAFGHIGGDARKFGLFFKREENQYWYNVDKYSDENEALSEILKQIQTIIEAGKGFQENKNVQNLVDIIDNKKYFDIHRQVRSKILAVYYPNIFLLITSMKYIDRLLDYFEIPKNKLRGQLALKQFKLLEIKESHPIMKNWTVYDYSYFLWNSLCATPDLDDDEDDEFKFEPIEQIPDEQTFEDVPLPFPSVESLQKAKQTISEQLLVDETKIEQIISNLISGKNVLLTGPVGSGKTHLATILPKLVWADLGGYYSQVYTATADWTTQDVIGGIYPKVDSKNNITYDIQKGCVAETVSKNWQNGDSSHQKRITYSDVESSSQFRGVWLVIDEFNRANIDRSFGQLFTALEYGHLQIPTTLEGKSFKDLIIPQDYRIIGTLNTADKHFLHSLSDALKRRFAIIEIPTPTYEQKNIELYYVSKKGLSDLTSIKTSLQVNDSTKEIITGSDPEVEQILETLHYLMSFLREVKPLGTALLISMFRFMVVHHTITNNWQKSLDLVLTSSIVPQLESLPYWTLKVIRAMFCQDLGQFFKSDPEIQRDGTENYRKDFEALIKFLKKVKPASNTILKRFKTSSLTDEDYLALNPWTLQIPKPSLPNFRNAITQIIEEKGITEESDIEDVS